MTTNSSTNNRRKIRFGYVVAAKLTSRHYLMGLHDDKEVAEAHRDRLQAYHDARPDLGNVSDISVNEAMTRREKLVEWRKNHPLGTALDHFERYDVLNVPWLESDILTNPTI